MQPFGLLNFIKSVLDQGGNPPQAPAKTPEDDSPSEGIPPSLTPPPTEAPTNNPFVDFCAAHDERAKRIKKK